MDNQLNQDANRVEIGDPREAEPGRGAPGEQWGVQTAQATDVNAPDAIIPTDEDVEKNIEQLEDYAKQEEGTLPTTHGYVIDEAGKIDNFAIEPPMYVEEK